MYGQSGLWYVRNRCVAYPSRFLTSRTQIWDLFEGGRLFRAVRHGHLDDEQHLAEMVSLLGPPPKEFLERSKKCRQYWDADGEYNPDKPCH